MSLMRVTWCWAIMMLLPYLRYYTFNVFTLNYLNIRTPDHASLIETSIILPIDVFANSWLCGKQCRP